MDKRREDAFWEVIDALNELGLLPYISVLGSWAEYLYESLFDEHYIGPSTTRDIDIMYNNIAKPNKRVALVDELSKRGFLYSEDVISKTAKFYKDGEIELEFLCKAMGSGTERQMKIEPIGIVSDSMRDINILDNTMQIEQRGYLINVPEPAAFVIQKILIYEHRVPQEKRYKDIEAVNKILPYIVENDYHKYKFNQLYNSLSKKQLAMFKRVCVENQLKIDEIIL